MVEALVTKKIGRAALLSLCFLALSQQAGAVSTTWTGGVSNEWHLDANWSAAAPNAATDGVISIVPLQLGSVIDLSGENVAVLSVDSTVPIATTQALLIHAGGTLSSNSNVALIGNSAPTQGNVTVDGVGSSWTSIGFLIVGNFGTGTGTLNITNGGSVASSGCTIGNNAGIDGIVNISGSSSSWTNSSGLLIGNSTNGTLNVSGGVVSSGTIILGNVTGAGTLNVSGGSVITPVTTDVVILGNDTGGNGTCTISGGTVTTALVVVANNGGFAGSLTIDNQGTLITGGIAGGPGTRTVLFGDAPNGQGIVQASADSATFFSGFSPGEMTIGGDGLLIDSQSFAIGTSNVLGGTGALTKTGSGTLTLGGTNTYIGGTTVSEGQLAVTGSLASGVTVGSSMNHSPILSGTGTVTGNVVNFGILAPGTSPGTLTIQSGDVTITSSSTLQIEVNPSVASEVLVHAGNFHIENGATFALFPDDTMGLYTPGKTYPVVAVDPGFTVTGTFSQITSSSSVLTGFLIYSTEEILLKIGRANLARDVTSRNARSVATALDTIFASGNLAFSAIFDSLLLLDSSQLTAALDQMHPALYKGVAVVQENNAVSVRNALTERFQVALDNEYCFTDPVQEKKPCKQEKKPCQQEKVHCKSEGKKWHIWIEGLGDFLHQSRTTFFDSPQVGYQSNTGGVVSGIDYHFRYFYAGALGAYTHSDVKWQANHGDADIDTGYAGLYLSALGDVMYGNFSVMGGWSNYDERRNIIYTGVNQTAKNSHHGQQIISHVDTGLNFNVEPLTIRPFDSFDWIVQREDSFRENGAGTYDLAVRNTHAILFRNELGVNFASCYCFRGTRMTWDAKLSWVREMRTSGKSTTSAFEEAIAVPFTVIGYFPSRNLFSFGASLSAVALKDLLTSTIYYNGLWGHKYSDNGIGAALNFGF